MKRYLVVLLFLFACGFDALSQTQLASGEQPQVSIDNTGLIRLVYGNADKIYLSTSQDNGKTFSKPSLVGEVKEMHLGMARGPQLASSKDFSVVTAMDKTGNIHSFKQSHKTGKWEKIQNVNDQSGSAPEGLMSIAADENNNFYAVWLDLRNDRQNNICFSTLKGNSGWSKNKFVYKSPDSHVCECCKPSIAAKGNNVSIMFRNWLRGSRDLYLITSSDKGQTFSDAQKLGNGTWQLKGCPMDGGGLALDGNNNVNTAWQREGIVYYAQPGQQEERLGEGRHVSLSGDLVSWENGSSLVVKRINGEQKQIGEGKALQVYELRDKSVLAVWEMDDQIVFKKI